MNGQWATVLTILFACSFDTPPSSLWVHCDGNPAQHWPRFQCRTISRSSVQSWWNIGAFVCLERMHHNSRTTRDSQWAIVLYVCMYSIYILYIYIYITSVFSFKSISVENISTFMAETVSFLLCSLFALFERQSETLQLHFQIFLWATCVVHDNNIHLILHCWAMYFARKCYMFSWCSSSLCVCQLDTKQFTSLNCIMILVV